MWNLELQLQEDFIDNYKYVMKVANYVSRWRLKIVLGEIAGLESRAIISRIDSRAWTNVSIDN